MSRKILGIDIRYDAVSAALVRSGIKGNWIEDYMFVPISGQGSGQGEDSNDGPGFTVGVALETIRSRMETDGSVFVVSFPADQVSYRNIQVPFRDTKKIRQMIPFELEPTLPFPVDELVIDFHAITNSKRVPDANHTDIIAATAETARIQSYMDALVSLGMDPEIITLGGYPAALCLARFSDTPENWILVDIGRRKCTVFVVISGQISLIRSFPVSFSPGTAQKKAELLCNSIQYTLAAFDENFDSEFQPDEIHITGYGLDYPGLEHEAELILDIPVKRADIIRDTGAVIKYAPRDIPPEHRTQMDNAFALALLEIEGISSINFRKGQFAPKRQWAEHKGSFIKTGILALLVLAVVFFNIGIEYNSMKKQDADLKKQINDVFRTTFPDVKNIVEPLHQMKTAVQKAKKVELIPEEMEKSIKVIDIFNDISKLIPKKTDVELSRLVITQENVQVSGNTDTFNSVDEIQSHLEQSAFFRKVTIISTRKQRRGNRIEFKIKADLKKKSEPVVQKNEPPELRKNDGFVGSGVIRVEGHGPKPVRKTPQPNFGKKPTKGKK